MKRVLLTSICRPIGPEHGDAPSVGYELLFSQVTRAQGLFSPRSLHPHFSLEYIAQNISAPAVVLQYPSRKELIRELKKGYDYVGISFLLAVFHKMEEAVALVRRHAPGSKIVLGGYGTVMDDAVLKPYADHICREEGVAFFRRLLGEPPKPIPYEHPLIATKLKLFSLPVSTTGMVFAGLGCANGCDFCCTSNFFKRRHIRLLPTGRDIHAVIERYLESDPGMSFVVLDEDFLLNKNRAMEFRDCVLKAGKPLSIFVFSSVRAISQYRVEEILEMGIDGFWIGYEGRRSGFAKQQGRPVDELFTELRQSGVTILASMIVGFDYQDEGVIREELESLLALKPALAQFLIYSPILGTPLYERLLAQGRLSEEALDLKRYCRKADGFTTLIRHPHLGAADLEAIQRRCFREDFERLGPSVLRVVEVWLLGYLKWRNSANPMLAAKALRFAADLRNAYPIFLAARLLGPSSLARREAALLEKRVHEALGAPTIKERSLSLLALGAALWTGASLKLGLNRHPRLGRSAYRFRDDPDAPGAVVLNPEILPSA